MSEIIKDLGTATAYGYAKDNGYDGTEEEFGVLMASYATVAEQAAESASDAASSASEAAQKVLDAQAQAEASASSATASASSATAAANSATASAASATQAETAKGQAQAYAQDAGGDAALALQYKNSAQEYAWSASTSATASATSATASATSASESEASATAAASSASDAADSATAAATSATEAEASAQSIDVDTLVHKDELAEELEEYARVDGEYEGMTVGNAEQIVTTVGVDDTTPYIFRTAGGSNDVADRKYVNAIVGGSLAWNQLAGNFTPRSQTLGVTIAVDNTAGTITVTGTPSVTNNLYFISNRPIDTNHVYYYCGAKANSNGNYLKVSVSNGMTIKNDTGDGSIFKPISGTNLNYQMSFGFVENQQVNVTWYPQLFDLTQMFGSTIADYIYSLEQATAGAGVAWFKKLFPKPYYAYNAGELVHVNASSHDTVGFNQWDEQCEVGAISSSTGESVSASNRIRSKNHIPVLPNTTYYLKATSTSSFTMYFYDADKTYLGVSYQINVINNTFVIPPNACYIRFNSGTDYGEVYKNDICINLSWDGSRNGEYEPYQKRSYALDSDLVLRGIPKLNANNNLYYDGDVYTPDGAVERKRIKITATDIISAYNDFNATAKRYMAFIYGADKQAPAKGSSDVNPSNAVCNVMLADASWSEMQNLSAANRAGVYHNSSWNYTRVYISINDSSVTSKETAEAWLTSHGFEIEYELATPTTESADPYQAVEIIDDFGTEEFVVTAPEDGVVIPVGHETFYPVNLKAKLEMAPNSPASGNGDYLVRQTDGENEYVPLASNSTISGLVSRVPVASGEDGNYVLKCVISGGVPTYAWVAE